MGQLNDQRKRYLKGEISAREFRAWIMDIRNAGDDAFVEHADRMPLRADYDRLDDYLTAYAAWEDEAA